MTTPARSATSPAAAGSPPQTAHRRYAELDILRFLAAFAVVGFHYLFRATQTRPFLADVGIHDPGHVFRYGYLGVDLFFAISGFVILMSAWGKRPSGFLISRVARLYPAFWVACTVTALVIFFAPGDRFSVSLLQWFGNLTMTPDLLGVDQVDGVYWTLFVELKFYLLVLLLCMVGLTRRRLLAFTLAWLGLSLLSDVVTLPRLVAAALVPQWAPYFVTGIIFFLIAREGWSWRYGGILAVAYGQCMFLALHFAAGLDEKYATHFSTLVVAAVTTGIFAVFALIATHRVETRWARRLAVIGGLTYPLYLLHQNIGYVLFAQLQAVPPVARLAIVAGVVLALAVALHVYVERRYAVRFRAALTDWWERWCELRRDPLPEPSARQREEATVADL